MEIKFTYRFEAAHRFLNTNSKCSTPHGHSWYATLVLQSRLQHLNQKNMVEDFAILKKDWREFIDDVLDHSYLHHVADPLADILKKENAELRLLPFPGDPTTELVSLLCFNKMEVMLAHRKLQDIVRVKSLLIQETPTNAIQLDLDDKVRLFATLKTHTGWWADVNLHSRSIINVG